MSTATPTSASASASATSSAAAPVRWGVMGTGRICADFVRAARAVPAFTLVAVGSRSTDSATRFVAACRDARDTPVVAHGTYAALLADERVQAVYVGSPHSEHEAHVLAALRAGKHVLCEKAFATSAAAAERMIAEARERGLFLMEAWWTRFFPRSRAVVERLAAGAIGAVKSIDCTFGMGIAAGQRPLDELPARLVRPELAGGALLDIGVYVVAVSTMLMGDRVPSRVVALGDRMASGVDGQATIALQWHSDAASGTNASANEGASAQQAALSISFYSTFANECVVYGTRGSLTLHAPFWCGTRYTVRDVDGNVVEEREFALPKPAAPLDDCALDNFDDATHWNYTNSAGLAYEIDAACADIAAGRVENAMQTHAKTIAVMKILDDCRAQLGVRFPQDDNNVGDNVDGK